MEENKMLSMSQNEFAQKVDPIKLEESDELFLFKCTECGGVHFRHAGYVEVLMPFMRADKSKNVSSDSLQVKVCVKCRKSFVWMNEQMYDVSKLVDLEAWEKFETQAHKATGPGGEC